MKAHPALFEGGGGGEGRGKKSEEHSGQGQSLKTLKSNISKTV